MSDLRDTDNTDELDPTKRPPLRDNLGMGPVKVAAPMGGPSLVPPIGRPVSDTGVPMYSQGDAVPATGTAPPVNSHIAKAQQLEQEGSGVSQVQAKHPFWGGVLRGLDVAASIAAPRIAPEIPGTTAHHNALIGQQEGLANQDIAQQEKQAQTQDVQSQIPLRQAQTQDTEAQTEERLHPKPQLQMTDEGLVRVPQEGEATPVTIAGSGDTLMKPTAPDKPENAQLQAENAWLSRPENKGKDLADAQKWYTALSPQARQEFHISTPRDRGVIMAVPDGKGGTILQEIQPGQSVPTGSTTATQLGSTTVNQSKANQKQVGQLQTVLDEAQQAHVDKDLADKGNAPADVDLALAFFKTMKGTGSSGIRFTQQEQNLILGARSAGQGLTAVAQKVIGSGQPLTPDQRAKMVEVIDTHAKAAQAAIDRLGNGAADQPQKVTPQIHITRDSNGRITTVQ